MCTFFGFEWQDVFPVKGNTPLCHFVGWVSDDDVGECAFACSVESHHGVYFAVSDIEVDAFEYFFAIDAGV